MSAALGVTNRVGHCNERRASDVSCSLPDLQPCSPLLRSSERVKRADAMGVTKCQQLPMPTAMPRPRAAVAGSTRLASNGTHGSMHSRGKNAWRTMRSCDRSHVSYSACDAVECLCQRLVILFLPRRRFRLPLESCLTMYRPTRLSEPWQCRGSKAIV